MLTSSKRAKIARQFEIWARENNVMLCAQGMMAFLDNADVFDEGKINRYLSTIKRDNLSFTGIKKFEPGKYDTLERRNKKR